MKCRLLCCQILLAVLIFTPAMMLPPLWSAEPDTEGFVPLFNGKDLTGWVNVNCHPKTFFVKDNEIITTGRPTGYLRTEKQYENFILEFEWMHIEKTKMANSGLFVWGDPIPAIGSGYTRGIEVQVLCNFETDWATSHGDIFSIWGAKCTPDRPHPKGYERCLPSERRCKGGGEWNHYRVIANDGAIKLHVNGKEVSGVSKSNPRKGYLALESEGVECHFRNIRIKELPSTNPKPEEIADVASGLVSIFNGLDLEGWTADGKVPEGWRVSDGHLILTKSKAKPTAFVTLEKAVKDFEFLFDWKINSKEVGPVELLLSSDGNTRLALLPGNRIAIKQGEKTLAEGASKSIRPSGQYTRAVLSVQGENISVKVGKDTVVSAKIEGLKPTIGFAHGETMAEFMNLYLKTR